MNTIFYIIKEYWKWRNNWDDLCNRCGQCCYVRSLSETGEVEIDHSKPCQFLDEDTKLCSVYENRFEACSDCRKVNIFYVLFHPLMPLNCAYVQTFRVWKRKK